MKERIAAEYRIDRSSRDLAVVWQSTNKLRVHYRRGLRLHRQPGNNKNVLIFRPSLYNDDNDDDVEELDNTLKVVCSRVRCLYERFWIHVISRNTRTLFRRFVGFFGYASNSSRNRVEFVRHWRPFSTTSRIPNSKRSIHPFLSNRPKDNICKHICVQASMKVFRDSRTHIAIPSR